MEFTKEELADLKIMYNKAFEQKKNKFLFQKQEILVDYAKYLIEYLENTTQGK